MDVHEIHAGIREAIEPSPVQVARLIAQFGPG
jgi:hypothetical protein